MESVSRAQTTAAEGPSLGEYLSAKASSTTRRPLIVACWRGASFAARGWLTEEKGEERDEAKGRREVQTISRFPFPWAESQKNRGTWREFGIVRIGSKPLKIQAIGELTAIVSLIWCAPLPRGFEPIITGGAVPQYLLYYGNRKTENS
jgi:hypothetical protein